MVGNVSSDNGVSSWARILLEIAQPILDSDDIRQALAQAETDPDALREILVIHSDDLITSGPGATLEVAFESRIDWSILPLSWALSLSAGLIAAVAVGIVLLIFRYWILLPFFFLLFALGALAFLISLDSLRRPLEPVDITRAELTRDVVGPFVREQINRILDEQEHPAVMHVTTAPGLAELSDREQLVITESIETLVRLSTDMSSGSIGVSGPRGSGKTTLLRYFCDPSFEITADNRDPSRTSQDIRFRVTAPVDYDSRDFILHIFSKLCQEVQAAKPADKLNRRRRIGASGKGMLLVLLAIAVTPALVIVAVALPWRVSHQPAWTTVAAAAVGGIVLALVLLSWRPWFIRPVWRFPEKKGSLQDEARYWQVRIKYLQSFGAGSSSSMGMSPGIQLGISASHQITELPMTLPELIDTFQDFAARVIRRRREHFMSWSDIVQRIYDQELADARFLERTAAFMLTLSEFFKSSKFPNSWSERAASAAETRRRRAATRVRQNALRPRRVPDIRPRIVIGIDEIDKIDADSARRFLNDIKAVFGVPNCLYLVSVSDEALDIFEQRVLLGRTAFDSAFDEIIRARQLNFDSCRNLLRRRIAGIPDSLIAFCQVMSGGLPRDMIRTARSVVDASAQGQSLITEIALTLVTAEIDILKRTCIADLARKAATPTAESGFPVAVLRHDWPGNSPASVIAAIEKDFLTVSVPLIFRVGMYFYVTVAEVFCGELPETIQSLRQYHPADDACIDRLAQAGNTMSVNPQVGWELVTRFRTARGLRTLREPGSPLTTAT